VSDWSYAREEVEYFISATAQQLLEQLLDNPKDRD
jgi:hypothetical protein